MPTDTLSTTLAALSDPTRRAILARLAQGEATVTELAEPFAITLPAISKHLKVLEHAGLLTRSRDAQWRPCQLRPEGLKVAAEWFEDYRTLWEGRLDRMAAYLEAMQSATRRGPKARGRRPRRRNPPHGNPRTRAHTPDQEHPDGPART